MLQTCLSLFNVDQTTMNTRAYSGPRTFALVLQLALTATSLRRTAGVPPALRAGPPRYALICLRACRAWALLAFPPWAPAAWGPSARRACLRLRALLRLRLSL